MQYHEALQTLGKNFDPFLHIKKEEIIDETENFLVVAARAPYIENHLLIIPKKKIYVLKELSHHEQSEMFQLLEDWNLKLHKNHDDVNLLLRDGLVWGNTEKSVNHLHFHLIPDCPIWAEWDLNSEKREWFDDEKYISITTEIRKKFK